jgi:hypothetical protein
MNIDIEKLWQIVDKGGVIGICTLLTFAFVRGWVVPRWIYDKVEQDCDRMTEIALRGTELAERAATVAEKKVKNGD